MQFNHPEYSFPLWSYLDRNWLKGCGKCFIHSKYLNSTVSFYSLWKQQTKYLIIKLYSTPKVSLVPSLLLDFVNILKNGKSFYFIFMCLFLCGCVHIRAAQHQAKQHSSIDGQGANRPPQLTALVEEESVILERLAMLQWMHHIHGYMGSAN